MCESPWTLEHFRAEEGAIITVLAFWMVGPSAMGSVKGIPSSIMSGQNRCVSFWICAGEACYGAPAPPSCMPSMMSGVSSGVGYPAVKYATRALCNAPYGQHREYSGAPIAGHRGVAKQRTERRLTRLSSLHLAKVALIWSAMLLLSYSLELDVCLDFWLGEGGFL
jgi:hypothetical protein